MLFFQPDYRGRKLSLSCVTFSMFTPLHPSSFLIFRTLISSKPFFLPKTEECQTSNPPTPLQKIDHTCLFIFLFSTTQKTSLLFSHISASAKFIFQLQSDVFCIPQIFSCDLVPQERNSQKAPRKTRIPLW